MDLIPYIKMQLAQLQQAADTFQKEDSIDDLIVHIQETVTKIDQAIAGH